jgi:hypothetical protein
MSYLYRPPGHVLLKSDSIKISTDMKRMNKYRFILCPGIFLLLAAASNAQEPIWAKAVSGPTYEYGVDADLDSQGNLFIIGHGGSTMEIDSSSYTSNGGGDAFIAKLSTGGQVLWFKTLGANDALYSDEGLDIHVDINDDVVICVKSSGTDFKYDGQIIPGINSPGQYSGEGVIIKVDNNGNYLWHDHGSISSSFQNVATDAFGNVYLTGWFDGSITLGDTIQLINSTAGTTKDLFVAKYLPNGDLLWAKRAGGTVNNSSAFGHNIAIDSASGKVVVVGRFNKNIYFDTGVLSTTASYATFLVSYDASGTELWRNSLFGNGTSYCQGLDISPNGVIGVAGFNSLSSNPDGLVGFYDLSGNIQSEETYNADYCRLHSLDFNQLHECFITGQFQDSVSLGVAPDTITLRAVSGSFVLKLDSSLVPDWARQMPAYSENKVTCKSNRILFAGPIDEPFIYNYGTQTIINNSGDAIFAEFADHLCIVSDITTSSTDTSVTANNTSATYQWLDCNNNFAVIVGETGRTFFPIANGRYAVQITENNCVDTSECVAITSIGIIENNFGSKFALYPNPSSGNFSVDLGENYQVITVTLTGLDGKTIQVVNYKDLQLMHLKHETSPGAYLLKIEAGTKRATIRLVKK